MLFRSREAVFRSDFLLVVWSWPSNSPGSTSLRGHTFDVNHIPSLAHTTYNSHTMAPKGDVTTAEHRLVHYLQAVQRAEDQTSQAAQATTQTAQSTTNSE